MDKRLKINLLSKIFFCFKFRNDISHEEYQEIIFSPLFTEIFKEIRKDLFSYSETIDIEKEMTIEMKSDSEEFKRVKDIIRGADFQKELSMELKKELIQYLVFPFIISDRIEEELLREFKHSYP